MIYLIWKDFLETAVVWLLRLHKVSEELVKCIAYLFLWFMSLVSLFCWFSWRWALILNILKPLGFQNQNTNILFCCAPLIKPFMLCWLFQMELTFYIDNYGSVKIKFQLYFLQSNIMGHLYHNALFSHNSLKNVSCITKNELCWKTQLVF